MKKHRYIFGFQSTGWFPGLLGASLLGSWRSDSGITVDGSNNVSAWTDQSGNGRTLSQAASGQRPAYAASGGINNLPYLTYNPSVSNAFLTNATFPAVTQPTEMIFIVRAASGSNAANGYLCDFGAAGNLLVTVQGSGVSSVFQYDGSVGTSVTIPIGSETLIDSAFSGASSLLIVDGASTSTNPGAPPSTGGLVVGNNFSAGGFAFNGRLYECFIVNRLLTATERTSLHGYAKARYSTA